MTRIGITGSGLALGHGGVRLTGGGNPYLLYDTFGDTLAAGAINGTSSLPGPGTRNVTDTGSKITMAAGQLAFAGGVNDFFSTGIWLTPGITRAAGRVLRLTQQLTGVGVALGGFTATASAGGGGYDNIGLSFVGTGTISARRTTAGTSPLIESGLQSSTLYYVLRAIGRHVLADTGGAVKLLWWDDWNNTATLYPGISSFSMSGTFADMTVTDDRYYAVLALVSDSFNRADGVLGSTDGAGHAEANSGSGLTWTAQVGTWAIATNKASAALDGGLAVATVDAGTKDILSEIDLTRAGGVVGGVARWADADNHLRYYHDGTNCVLDQLVAGTPTTLVTAAATYAANASIRLHLDDNSAWLYYNDLYVGTSATINAGLTATAHGLYTTDADNTFDNAVLFARNGYDDLRVL